MPLANAMRLIPMNFGLTHSSICQTHQCYAFELSPAAYAINTPQPGNSTNRVAHRDNFDSADFADNFKRCH